MGERGLDKSIWASRGNIDTHPFPRPGDWNCPSCGFSNFQRRTECMRCSFGRTGTPRSSSPAVVVAQQPIITPQTEYANNRGNIFGSTTALVPSMTATSKHLLPKQEKGLLDSLWAPRNKTNNSQVWIKRHSENIAALNHHAYSNSSPTPTPTPLDLGLPYEVQHFILSMTQRILEEACYDFAFRWIPGVLNGKGWSCAEAVELSTWRDFLPDAVPPNAIVPVQGYSLQLGLKDAVKIRNAAVHRHLCDNSEIRHMAQQAEDLMTMFRDVTRQSKFHRLGAELIDWDRTSGSNQHGPRAKLEHALQEISERPMNDMDWTPNAVSLQEITSDVQIQAQDTQDTHDYGEAMELD